jgi:putative ABC transport system permease protein
MRWDWAATVAWRAAWACLRQHRWRSVLTLVMCGLGTAGVICAGLLARANLAEVQERFQHMGGGLIIVSPNKLPPYPGRPRQLDHFISLDPADGASLAGEVPRLSAVVPVAARNGTARLDGAATRVRIVGTTPGYAPLRNFGMHKGRFLHPADDGERVVVLGHAASQELAPGGVPRDWTVHLDAVPYTVIGVLQPQGMNFAGEDEDHQVFIPLATYRQRIANRPWLHHLYIQPEPAADSAVVAAAIQERLRARHGRRSDQVEDVIVRDLADVAARQASVLTTTTWAVSVTSGLLLVMGAAGVTALMVLVVRHRRAEIALRRAIGATPGDVAMQFFFEGVVLASTGGLAGLLLGSVTSLVLVHLLSLRVALDFALVGISAAVSLGCAAVASTVPAVLAARVEPGHLLRG